VILQLPDDAHLADLLGYLRENGRIAYYVGEQAVEVLTLQPSDRATVTRLLDAWDAEHPDASTKRRD
jgi:hypothetical protein